MLRALIDKACKNRDGWRRQSNKSPKEEPKRNAWDQNYYNRNEEYAFDGLINTLDSAEESLWLRR